MVSKGKGVAKTSPGSMITSGPIMGQPDFSNIISSPDITMREKRRIVLGKLNMVQPRKKYASVADRKAAAKIRSAARRKERLEKLPEELRPKARGAKLTVEQKKEKRTARAHDRRAFINGLAKEHPEMAKARGIDVSRLKIF